MDREQGAEGKEAGGREQETRIREHTPGPTRSTARGRRITTTTTASEGGEEGDKEGDE